MADYEDRDMKIVGSGEDNSPLPGDTAAKAFKLQLENGNLAKAKLLGEQVAHQVFADIVAPSIQKVILIRFCITNFITVALQNETLTHTAVDRVEEIICEQYGVCSDDDLVSEMYTVFLIASKERINVAEHIAQTYARFCDDRVAAVTEAVELYSRCQKAVITLVDQLNFVNLQTL